MSRESSSAARYCLAARLAAADWRSLRLASLALLLIACAGALAACGTALANSAAATATTLPQTSTTRAIAGLGAAVPSPVPPTGTTGPINPPPVSPTRPPTATATPTAQNRAEPTLGAFNITPIAGATVVTPHPTAVQPAEVGASIVNVLLIGTDYRPSDTRFRTDSLIVASINKTSAAVSLLSIPRDLYVYIPRYGMGRINLAYTAADSNNFPGGGPALLEQTILYNLGIPVHYYALVNFDGFRQIVDTLGGIDVAVNCQLAEYKLIDWTLDESEAANYELYTQPPGIAHMDGDVALWYARARPVGGDYFRGYRQRQVLRAIYQRGLRLNVLPQIPALYADLKEVVETDMSLWDIMQFVPLAAQLDSAQIRSLHIGPNQTTSWITPAGESVLLPRGEAIQALVAEYFAQANANRLARPLTWVEVASGSETAMPALAAETLINEGFAVRYSEPAAPHAATTIIDYTASPKGSPLKQLQSILHVTDDNVITEPRPNSPAQFRVVLGDDYNSCPRLDWMSP
jgi:polyisoprenyl-teichoic acid--peptidoglycan teichoic acid transferase